MEDIVLFACGALAFLSVSSPVMRATRRVWLQGIILLVYTVAVTLLCDKLELPEQLEQGMAIGYLMQLIATGQDALIRKDTNEGKDSKS